MTCTISLPRFSSRGLASHARCQSPLPRCRSKKNLKRSSHRNQQYSITAITDGSGGIVERYTYTAYGTPTVTDASGTTRTTTAIGNRYTYTGREWDDTLALYHYRARMYDSVGGRFCSRDPIGYPDGPNAYAAYFVPRDVDPSGEFLPIIIGVGIAILITTIDTDVANAPGPRDPIGDPNKDAKDEAIGNILLCCTPVPIFQCGKLIGQSLTCTARMTRVTRWGSPVQSGKWVMQGNPSCKNYVLSGKWQPVSNQFAKPTQCFTKKVKGTDLKWPDEGFSPTDFIKGCMGQRIVR